MSNPTNESTQEDVARLHVAMHNAALLQVLHRKKQFGHIETRYLLVQNLLFDHQSLQVPSTAVVEDEVEVALGLEGVMEGDDKGVGELLEDIAL